MPLFSKYFLPVRTGDGLCKGAIKNNIKRSLFLADKTAFNYYKDLAKKAVTRK